MKCALFALLFTTSALATPHTITDTKGVVHGTGYLGPQQPTSLDEERVYWAPEEDEVAAAPLKYDARSDNGKNYVAPIKDQGSCGSCWSFSITKTLESARLAVGGTYLNLAEQDALVNAPGMYGCRGGFMDASYWVNHGLTDEVSCPYRGSDRYRCRAAVKDKGIVWGFVGAKGRVPTESELVAAIYKYKVISITVAAGGADWSNPRGGKMTACRYRGVNHMVNLVGYDCTVGARCTFIGANSWGTGFGDKGFFYAEQGCNQMASTTDSALYVVHDSVPAL
jgi:C1A family cysteine protease